MLYHARTVCVNVAHHFDTVQRQHLHVCVHVVFVVDFWSTEPFRGRHGSGHRRGRWREQSAERQAKLLAHGAVDEEVDRVWHESEEVEIERRRVARLLRQNGRPERVVRDHNDEKNGERCLDEQKHADDYHQHHRRRATLWQSRSRGTRPSIQVLRRGTNSALVAAISTAQRRHNQLLRGGTNPEGDTRPLRFGQNQASTSAAEEIRRGQGQGTRPSFTLSFSDFFHRRRRRLVVVKARRTGVAFRVCPSTKQLVAATLGRTHGPNQCRVEDDQWRARNDVNADDAEPVVGVEQDVLMSTDAWRQDEKTGRVVHWHRRRRTVDHPARGLKSGLGVIQGHW